jgi:RimJ/RimL family protein N-acetyltransferase
MIGTDWVTLTPVRAKHWLKYRGLWKSLLSSPDSPLLFGSQRPRTPSWFDYARELAFSAPHQWRCHRFLIMLADQSIGVADIHEDRINSVCFLVMGLAVKYRARKFGTIAAKLMLRKCFTELGARRVESSVVSSNLASLKMQDGMIQEGTLKQRCTIGTEHYDEILFRILKTEWEEQNRQWKLRRATQSSVAKK